MDQELHHLLSRLTEALERLAPPPPLPADLALSDAFVWHPEHGRLLAVATVSRVPIKLLQGIERQKTILLDNTRHFTRGLPANNAMLWGARGMGKSSLVKAVHAAINAESLGALALIEIHREDIATLPSLLGRLRKAARRCLVFCDDLSFEYEDSGYKALKSVLEGGIEGHPPNVLFYTTSNRRHLMGREMIENERASAIIPSEAMEEKVSLSDRFGLWIGFHHCDQEMYFTMVEAYAAYFSLPIAREALRFEAVEWSVTRGARSGRVAWQFIQNLAGRLGIALSYPPSPKG